MNQTSVNFRMDLNTKKEFEKFCLNAGMSMSTAFNIFAKQTLKEQRIPFQITGENGRVHSLKEEDSSVNGNTSNR